MSTEQTLNSENDRLEPMKLLNIQNKIKVNSDLESLMATAILKVKLHQKTDTLVLDLAENCNVKEAKATQNGNEIPLDANHKEGKLYLLSKLPLDGNLDINILYHTENPKLDTSTFVVSSAGSYASWIHSWYPRIIGQRSSGVFSFEIEKGHSVACTGYLSERVDLSESTTRWIFTCEQPTDFGFASAKYHVKSFHIDDLNGEIFFLRDNGEMMDRYVPQIQKIIKFYMLELFEMYPYQNYALVEIPSKYYAYGGSSEQNMNYFPDFSLPEHHFNFPFFSHELGHSYWGSYVIGKNVVLSEGLAQMSSLLAMERYFGEEVMRQYAWYGSYESFQGIYIYASMVAGGDKDIELEASACERIMDQHLISNTKGHYIFIMLRDYLGASQFAKGLQSALRNYPHKRMTIDQLFEEWEQVCGKDLRWFKDQYFGRRGIPNYELDYSIKQVEDTYVIDGRINQHEENYITDIEIHVKGKTQKQIHTVRVEEPNQEFTLVTNFEPVEIQLDLDKKVLRWTDEMVFLKNASLAFSSLLSHDYEASAGEFERLLQVQPDCHILRFWLVRLYFSYMENWDKAHIHIDHLLDELEATPKLYGHYQLYFPHIFLYKGKILEKSGDLLGAEDYFRRVQKQDKTGLYHNIAQYYLQNLDVANHA